MPKLLYCAICGNRYYVKPSRVNGSYYCSKSCHAKGTLGKAKRTERWRNNISQSLKGKKLSEEHKKNISKSKTGIKQSSETIAKRVAKNIGQKRTEETKKKMGNAQRGEKCHWWKGGISSEPYTVNWTETLKRAIRERDKYICKICGLYGLHVHHIDYNKKNCNLNNLITLCNGCHSKTNHNRDCWINYFNTTP